MKRFNTNTANLIPAFQQDWGVTFDNIQELAFSIFGSEFKVLRGLTYDTGTNALTDGCVMMNGVFRYVPAGIPVGSYIIEDNELADLRGSVYAYTSYKAKVSATATTYPALTIANIEIYRYKVIEKWDLTTGVETAILGKTWNGDQVYGLKLNAQFNAGTYSWQTNMYNIKELIFVTGQLHHKPSGSPFYREPYVKSELAITVDYLNYLKLERPSTITETLAYDLYLEYTKN